MHAPYFGGYWLLAPTSAGFFPWMGIEDGSLPGKHKHVDQQSILSQTN